MEKLTVYKLAALLLLVLNLGLLAFLFFGPHTSQGAGAPALKVLQFDDQQHEAFKALAQVHRAEMRDLTDRQRALLREHFRQLSTDQAETPLPLPPDFAELEQEKIGSTYHHFIDVKKILRPEQREHFPQFVEQAVSRILLGPKKAGPGRRKLEGAPPKQ